jgi:hypothetical protein
MKKACLILAIASFALLSCDRAAPGGGFLPPPPRRLGWMPEDWPEWTG